MSPHLESLLHERYPILFQDRKQPSSQLEGFHGCDCGDGWFPILDHTFGFLTQMMKRPLCIAYLETYREAHRKLPNYFADHQSYFFKAPSIILEQVKSQYNRLRILYRTDQEEIPEEVWANLDLKMYYKEREKYNQKIENVLDFAEYQSSLTPEHEKPLGKIPEPPPTPTSSRKASGRWKVL